MPQRARWMRRVLVAVLILIMGTLVAYIVMIKNEHKKRDVNAITALLTTVDLAMLQEGYRRANQAYAPDFATLLSAPGVEAMPEAWKTAFGGGTPLFGHRFTLLRSAPDAYCLIALEDIASLDLPGTPWLLILRVDAEHPAGAVWTVRLADATRLRDAPGEFVLETTGGRPAIADVGAYARLPANRDLLHFLPKTTPDAASAPAP